MIYVSGIIDKGSRQKLCEIPEIRTKGSRSYKIRVSCTRYPTNRHHILQHLASKSGNKDRSSLKKGSVGYVSLSLLVDAYCKIFGYSSGDISLGNSCLSPSDLPTA